MNVRCCLWHLIKHHSLNLFRIWWVISLLMQINVNVNAINIANVNRWHIKHQSLNLIRIILVFPLQMFTHCNGLQTLQMFTLKRRGTAARITRFSSNDEISLGISFFRAFFLLVAFFIESIRRSVRWRNRVRCFFFGNLIAMVGWWCYIWWWSWMLR